MIKTQSATSTIQLGPRPHPQASRRASFTLGHIPRHLRLFDDLNPSVATLNGCSSSHRLKQRLRAGALLIQAARWAPFGLTIGEPFARSISLTACRGGFSTEGEDD